MFGKKDNQSNERVIYQAKPNLILGCKKAILALILLIFILCLYLKLDLSNSSCASLINDCNKLNANI